MVINKKILIYLLVIFSVQPMYATVAWWDTDWHYRVAVTINSAVTHQTGKVDFNSDTLGLGSDLDENSIRVVKSNGTLLAKQEFTDRLYANSTDSTNNNRGEVKFIIEDTGTVTYYIYYDKIANGAKSNLANSYVINGNLEHSTSVSAIGWNTGSTNIGSNQPNNEAHPIAGEGTSVTAHGATVENTAHTGKSFHLQGYRSLSESGSQSEIVYMEKTFTVPSSSSGSLSYWFRVQAFDDINYDYVQVTVNGTIINHNNLGISNASLRIVNNKYGRGNSYGGYSDAGWTKATLNLASYSGTSITVRIAQHFASDNSYATWQLIDDFEWSLNTTSSLGSQEVPATAKMSITKNSCVINDPINGSINPKRIAGATIRYALEVKNEGAAEATDVIITDNMESTLDETTIRNLQIQLGTCNCLGVTSSSNNGVNGTANGVNPVKLDFDTVPLGSVGTPTIECGYFEINVK